MNKFEKQLSELRIQFRNERVEISKATARTIGRLNNAIGQVTTDEARDALRAERTRIAEAGRKSMELSRVDYAEQRELLEDQYRRDREENPSNRQLRRALRALRDSIGLPPGQFTYGLSLGDGQRCAITFYVDRKEDPKTNPNN